MLSVRFFQSEKGREPVREWLKSLPIEQRKSIGRGIKVVQFDWPTGMPLVRKLEPKLWELRLHLDNGITRVFFTLIDEL